MAAAAFQRIGGHVALDFVNTVDWRADPTRRRDLLVAFEDLLAWAKASTLLGTAELRAMSAAARRDEAAATRSLGRARRLREVLARVLAAAGRNPPPAAGAAGPQPEMR